MCNSVEEALQEHFGYTLASPEVVILDPATGTGNFIVNLIKRMPGKDLPHAYRNRLFANEVMLLPYYVSSLNIEHAYYERMGTYESFEGLCFVDTLDMQEARQLDMFTPANTARVQREKDAAITVIIGNPPYNVGQKSENDNNANRKYKHVDQRIRETYAKDSKATNKNSLSDMYVKFFRWATDRLGDQDGIICLVTNNSFVDQHAFDGMRKHLAQNFEQITHIDLHGNVRRNPKISGTTHNVFGIQVGVGITLAVKKRGLPKSIKYFRVPEMWRKGEKLNCLASEQIPWQSITPNSRHTWIVPTNADEYDAYPHLFGLFDLYTVGMKTSRDEVVYDWDRNKLSSRMRKFISDYNAEVHRHKADPTANWKEYIKWSETLKQNASRGRLVDFHESRIRVSLYRPFEKKWLYFDRSMNERVYQWPNISGRVIVTSDLAWRAPTFNVLMTDSIADVHLCAAR